MSSTPREIGTLIVVLKADYLLNIRHIEKQDPYCLVTVNGEKRRTNIQRGGQHPEWDGEICFTLFEDVDDMTARGDTTAPLPPPKYDKTKKIKGGKTMKLACYTDDPREPELIGETEVDLTEVLTKGETEEWFDLSNKDKFVGRVCMGLTFWSNDRKYGGLAHDANNALVVEQWQTILALAKDLQSAIHLFSDSLQTTINSHHPETPVSTTVASCSSQLTQTGDAILTFAETLSIDGEGLVESLLSETSKEATDANAKAFGAIQLSAIKALAASTTRIVESHARMPVQLEEIPSHTGSTMNVVLSPDAQAIADGFKKLLGEDGENDPRMHFGLIPARHRAD